MKWFFLTPTNASQSWHIIFSMVLYINILSQIFVLNNFKKILTLISQIKAGYKVFLPSAPTNQCQKHTILFVMGFVLELLSLIRCYSWVFHPITLHPSSHTQPQLNNFSEPAGFSAKHNQVMYPVASCFTFSPQELKTAHSGSRCTFINHPKIKTITIIIITTKIATITSLKKENCFSFS